MNHVRIIANGFRALGVVFGIAALALLFIFGGSLFALAHPPAVAPSHPLDVGTYGIVGLLQNGAIGLSQTLGFLGAIGLWAGVVMTVVGFVFLVLAIILFFTGRGIAAHRGWARVAGFVFGALILLTGWSIGFGGSHAAAAAALALIAAAIYAVWVLGWRYVAPRY